VDRARRPTGWGIVSSHRSHVNDGDGRVPAWLLWHGSCSLIPPFPYARSRPEGFPGAEPRGRKAEVPRQVSYSEPRTAEKPLGNGDKTGRALGCQR
jgi:hypothetical protein